MSTLLVVIEELVKLPSPPEPSDSPETQDPGPSSTPSASEAKRRIEELLKRLEPKWAEERRQDCARLGLPETASDWEMLVATVEHAKERGQAPR